MIPNKPGIYKLINKINGKIYIGKTVELRRRILYTHRKGRSNQVIHKAIKKYGWLNFEIKILHTFDYLDNNELLWIEGNYIQCFKSYKRTIGYNILQFGTDRTGTKTATATKEKISKANMGSKNGNFGKKASQAVKLRMSMGRKLAYQKLTLEDKQKIYASAIANETYKGKNNGRFDETIFQFQQLITGKHFKGNRFDFYTKHHLDASSVNRLIKGRQHSVGNWLLIP